MNDGLDRVLLSRLLHGTPSIDPATGQIAIGPDGEPVFVAPSAAILREVRARLKDLAVTGGSSPYSDELRLQMNRMGLVNLHEEAARRLADGRITLPSEDDE